MTCPEEIKQMWEIVKESFKDKMSSAAFEMWYGGITPTEYLPETNTLVFETKSEFISKGLTDQHKSPVENAFLTQAGMQLNVILVRLSSSDNRPLRGLLYSRSPQSF